MTKTTLARSLLLVAAFAAFLPAQAPQAQNDFPVISIEFQGGSLRELIDAMRRIDPKLNITASALAKEVKLPDLSLKGASVMNVLHAAASIAPGEYVVASRAAGAGGGGEPVYIVSVAKTPRPGTGTTAQAREERETSVFSLRSLVEPQPGDSKDQPIHLSVDAILSALEAGVKLAGAEQADLKYHRDAGLLFAKGTSPQLDVVRQVLQNVQRDQTEVRNAMERQRQHAAQQARSEKQVQGADKK